MSALDEWLALCPGHFTPGTGWIGGWVGCRTGLDVVAKRKTADPAGNPRPPTP